MNILVYLLVCLFFILLFVVGIYNTEDVTVNLILWHAGPAPMGAVIATAAILGIAFACAIGILDGIKIRIANRQLRRQLQRLDEECDALRLQLARHQGPTAPVAGEKEKARSF
ncbi:MAG TPA: lipopolysaccharide assembly protein LapA domain-containing protein [Candidatus Polarisedimenticolia bacterium]|jgi:uncharacterized integral membrane protein|nr:lipopolysaccharide assembly protein LapA domain-containing protein [Candidatus Polarisedimenticolia bacterium]